MKLLLFAILFVCVASAATIQLTSDGRAGSSGRVGWIFVQFSSDEGHTCQLFMESSNPLAKRGASATLSVNASGSGVWHVVAKNLIGADIFTKIANSDGQGGCLLRAVDESVYSMGARFDVTVR